MDAKRNAAAEAVALVKDGMTVGLGSGSTANYAIEMIGARVQQGLRVRAIASSIKSEALARKVGIELLDNRPLVNPDIALDGADEVDTEGNLLKGGGGSLLREKILAFSSKQFFVMVDDSKMVKTLGKRPLPVEMVPFAASLTLLHLESLGCKPEIRQIEGKDFITDNGNLIADCSFEEVTDPAWLDMRLKMIPGVIETGLFLRQIVTGIIIGFRDSDTKLVDLSSSARA